MRKEIIGSIEQLKSCIEAAGRVIIHSADQAGIVLGGFVKGAGAEIICYTVAGKSRRKTLRGAPVVKISDVEDRSALVLVSAREEMHVTMQSMLAALGFENIALVKNSVHDKLRAVVPVYLDFMCPGFPKCGTTTLQEVLKDNASAYLPPAKETFFLQWYKKEDSTRILRERHYRHVKMGQMIGDIDPAHYNRAKDAHEYFGDDLKIVIMLRDPAAAEFSMFKMMCRFVYREKYVEYFKTHKKFGQPMFMDYIKNQLMVKGGGRRFEYAHWIEEYMKYYPRENIKIVLMEDMLKNPREVLDDIQEFLGLDVMHFDTLPRANEGKKVSRGWRSARVNLWVFGIDEYRKSRLNSLPTVFFRKVVKPVIYAFTLVDNDEKLSPEARKLVTEHYMPSIKRLEEIMGRSLEGLWY